MPEEKNHLLALLHDSDVLSELEEQIPNMVVWFQTIVKPKILQAQVQEKLLAELTEKTAQWKQKEAIARASLQLLPSSQFIEESNLKPLEYQPTPIYLLIPLGLSVLLLVSILNKLDIDATELESNQYGIVLGCFMVSVAIVFAIERAIFLMSKQRQDIKHRLEDDRLQPLVDFNYDNFGAFKNNEKPNPYRFAKPTPAIISICFMFVGLEGAFTYSGLTAVLNPAQNDAIYKLSLLCASLLTSAVNVILSYYHGLEASNYEAKAVEERRKFDDCLNFIRNTNDEKAILEKNTVLQQKIAEAEQVLYFMIPQQAHHLQVFLNLKSEALKALNHWEESVRIALKNSK